MNERIARLDEATQEADFGDDAIRFDFLCECGGDADEVSCDAHVEMTLDEYEEVRAQDDRFVLVAGHENTAIEHVVRRTERFVIVDKKPAAEPFVDDDPRGAPST